MVDFVDSILLDGFCEFLDDDYSYDDRHKYILNFIFQYEVVAVKSDRIIRHQWGIKIHNLLIVSVLRRKEIYNR